MRNRFRSCGSVVGNEPYVSLRFPGAEQDIK
jgi:hypothetical protein